MEKTRILIVEDQEITAKVIQENLLKIGYEVTSVVAFGEEVVKSVEEGRPDLVLMDIELKGEMDGIEAAGEVRARFDIPVVYLTAYGDEEKLRRARLTGPFGYLIKPFGYRELYTTIEIALYRYRMESELRQYRDALWNRMLEEKVEELLEVNKRFEAEIAERKQSDEHVRKLQRVVEQCPCVVMVTDTAGNIEYVNPYFTQLTGYTLDEVKGKNLRILKSGEQSQMVYEELWTTITSGKKWRGELYNRKKDGLYYWESASIIPLKNPEGVVTNFIKIAEDITERKRLDEELMNARCELEERVAERTAELSDAEKRLRLEIVEHKQAEEQANILLKEREVLLCEIHHRVKNNMQIIISLLRLQSRYVDDKRCMEVFNECEYRIKSMAIIHEMLYKSKNLAKIDLNEYIMEIANELFDSYGVGRDRIRLNIDIRGGFPRDR